ncbi:hypothetical protein [Spiroplasma sp. BIUS-1]|uniref:hypothetical protein n=1 Tax=Spiroplasma sp. BIUS-1 TaxID=216964 RepID=UPI0013980A9F|nr:hypothetical protein [Spiroplasma sp. BIUS-1]QHX36566.1 hypothetical protein SBIUS_v1c03130 [Spiroplasma sp. BIUS-1]
MNIYKNEYWVYYETKKMQKLEKNVGKWIIGYNLKDSEWAISLCTKVIENEIISSVKHTNPNVENFYNSGVICFYLELEDKEGHRRLLDFLIKNKAISINKNGLYKNIAFKQDEQTSKNEYGEDFKASLNLKDFVDLNTGKLTV